MNNYSITKDSKLLKDLLCKSAQQKLFLFKKILKQKLFLFNKKVEKNVSLTLTMADVETEQHIFASRKIDFFLVFLFLLLNSNVQKSGRIYFRQIQSWQYYCKKKSFYI